MNPTCHNCRYHETDTPCEWLGHIMPPVEAPNYHCVHWAPNAETCSPVSLWRAYKLARLAYQSGAARDGRLATQAAMLYAEWQAEAKPREEYLFDPDYRRPRRDYEATAIDILPGQYLRWYGHGSMGHRVAKVERLCSDCSGLYVNAGHRLVVRVKCDHGMTAVMFADSEVVLSNQVY
jgi:hypothetical protein